MSINLKSDLIYKVGDKAEDFDLWKYVKVKKGNMVPTYTEAVTILD